MSRASRRHRRLEARAFAHARCRDEGSVEPSRGAQASKCDESGNSISATAAQARPATARSCVSDYVRVSALLQLWTQQRKI
jgi:hypothetical protein